MKNLIRIARKLKANPVKLRIRKLGDITELTLLCFVDASYGSLNDKKDSAHGYLTLLAKEEICSVLTWNSKKIKTVATSVQQAELAGLVKGMYEVCYLRELISEIVLKDIDSRQIPIVMYSDSLTLVNLIHHDTQTPDVQNRKLVGAVREKVEAGSISLVWIKGSLQLADVLTKESSPCKEHFLRVMNGQLKKS